MTFFLLVPLALSAQDLSGTWLGWIQMEDTAPFHYRLELEAQGQEWHGYSWSATADSSIIVQFKVVATQDGDMVQVQELEQLSPAPPQWCLKYLNLSLLSQADSLILSGTWKGKPCPSGTARLYKEGAFAYETEQLPFSILGDWTGQLEQTDRSYGFFYSLDLEKEGIGSSKIVSEGSGGSAFHELKWTFDERTGQLHIQEIEVIERTDPKWKWCIKEAFLQLEKTDNAYIFRGNWSGHIEGDRGVKGACAPGQVYLEKPILSKKVWKKIQETRQIYEKEQGRKVEVSRVLEVKRREVKLSVWDNSVVDGDIVSVFLNGEKIIHEYAISREKAFVDIVLKEKDNFLILHAEDLGEITPNTVAVSIFDGTKEYLIIVSSDLKESGAILVKRIDIK